MQERETGTEVGMKVGALWVPLKPFELSMLEIPLDGETVPIWTRLPFLGSLSYDDDWRRLVYLPPTLLPACPTSQTVVY